MIRLKVSFLFFVPRLSLDGVGSWRMLSSVQRSSGPRHLVDLPEDYSTLINAAADFKCANNVVGECKNPVMCLSCGIILCSMVSIHSSD